MSQMHAPEARTASRQPGNSGSAPDPRERYAVTSVTRADLDAMARVHVASFGDSFLASMGVRFLRHYFRAFLDEPHAVAMVCRQRSDGKVIGFVCGSEDVARHYRTFLRHRLLPALPAVAARVVREPGLGVAVLQRAWRVAWMNVTRGKRGRDEQVTGRLSLPPASLMTIGVHPDFRRQGVGELLARAFTREMARRGVGRVKLGVRADNAGARRLYERLGWEQVEPASGGGSYMYVKTIQTGQPDGPSRSGGSPNGTGKRALEQLEGNGNR